MLENPIFFYDSEFISDDDSNFIDEYVSVLTGIQKFYSKDLITTGSIALIQATTEEYLFIVSNTETYDILRISGFGEQQKVAKVASFEKLKLRRGPSQDDTETNGTGQQSCSEKKKNRNRLRLL